LEKPVQSEIVPEGFFIHGPRPINNSTLYQTGKIDLQSISSMLMPHLLGIKAGQKILDACAGSGGKSCHMADLIENQGEIICIDHNREKLRALQKRSKRLGAKICFPVCGDFEKGAPLENNLFEKVLVDAPCSSLGIIHRHPEIRWLRKEQDLQTLSQIQKNILKQVARSVCRGGQILYCTCSTEPEETNDIMEDFLQQNPRFEVINFRKNLPNAYQGMLGKDGALRLLPFSHGADGFFAFSVRKYE
jgi:16S rRNA (cytosine967-C5)-methyltransferase